jgi:hypothetical protein
MGYLTFVVEQDGLKTVRWRRLLLAWITVIFSCVVGAGATSYALTGDLWAGAGVGIALGVFYASSVTVSAFLAKTASRPSRQV